MASSVRDFYDGLAAEYHLVYGDHWDDAVARQGEVLDGLIRGALGGPVDVLDCSCGIGTQAIGLALRGHRVVGTDISERSLKRARAEAARLGAEASFRVADFRDLDGVDGPFDVVFSRATTRSRTSSSRRRSRPRCGRCGRSSAAAGCW